MISNFTNCRLIVSKAKKDERMDNPSPSSGIRKKTILMSSKTPQKPRLLHRHQLKKRTGPDTPLLKPPRSEPIGLGSIRTLAMKILRFLPVSTIRQIYLLIGLPPKQSIYREPDQGLRDIYQYWVLNSLNKPYVSYYFLMLDFTLIFGAFTFWGILPQVILHIDPTAVLSPNNAAIMCQNFTDNPHSIHGPDALVRSNEIMVEVYASHANLTVEDFKLDTGKRALAYTITSMMIGIMLNSVVTQTLFN